MAKGWALSTGNLPREGLPRNSVDRINDRPDMTSAVDRGRKALTQLNSIILKIEIFQLFKASHSTYSLRLHRLQNSFKVTAISTFIEINLRRESIFWTFLK